MVDAEVLPTLSIIATVITGVGTLAIWLSGQFRSVNNLVYNKTEQLQKYFSEKIDAHEVKDDKRFEDLNDDLWILRVRLAAADVNGNSVKSARKNAKRKVADGLVQE